MSWEYSGDPQTTPKDEVRFLLGDTDEVDPQLQDEEIDYLVVKYGDPATAAAAGASALAGKYARLVSKAVGDLRLDLSDRADHYRALAVHIATGSGVATVPVPIATGITKAAKQAAYDDDGRVPSQFVIEQDDDPRTPDQQQTVRNFP